MNKPQKLNQDGIVSFLTVMFLAMVLILITTGFVRAMNSNLRESLDNQLSTQAFYAAESGVNDALAKINSGIGDLFTNPSYKTDCNALINTINNGTINRNTLEESSSIKYSCLLLNPTPDDITFKAGVNEGKIYKLDLSSGTLGTLKISWGDDGASIRNVFRTNFNLPKPGNVVPGDGTNDWSPNTPALLRVSFYFPRNSGPNPYSRTNLISQQKTYFLIPSTLASSSYTTDGSKNKIRCDSSITTQYKCVATIDLGDVGANGNSDDVYVRIVPLYNTADIKLEGCTGNCGGAGAHRPFAGAQYSIDATGRANDVYRRISVRKDYGTTYSNMPEAVVNNLCKQFIVWPGSYQDESGCSF